MMRVGVGSILLTVFFAGAASAQVPCTAPFLPVIPDGATATEEELNTIRGQVEAFMRDSEDYQQCLVINLRQAETEAARDEDKEMDPAIRRTTIARVNTNQSHKVRLSEEFNAAARAYNEAHPPKDSAAAPQPGASPES